MLKQLIAVTVLFGFVNIWALNSSSPTTISDLRFNVRGPRVAANENGEVLVSWLSNEGHTEAVTVSYKTLNLAWSSPECISDWEQDIFHKESFIDSRGDSFLNWEIEKDGDTFIQIAKKRQGNSGIIPVSSLPCSGNFNYGFDSFGNFIFINRTKVKNLESNKEEQETAIALRLFPQSDPLPAATGSDIVIESKEGHIHHFAMTTNKDGLTYVFWISNFGQIVCQKIKNEKPDGKPEVIYHSKDGIPIWRSIRSGKDYRSLEVRTNDKGHIALVFQEDNGQVKVITKFGETWSQPFMLAELTKYSLEWCTVIDDQGNIMWVYKEPFYHKTIPHRYDCIKAIYMPFGKVSMKPIELGIAKADNTDFEIKLDGQGNFVMVWECEIRNRQAIFGATFSTIEQTWSEPQRLSPEGENCYNASFVFFAPGKGYISWVTSPNGFDSSIQVAELSN